MTKAEFTDAENRLDSQMQPGEFGEPVTMGECELAADGKDYGLPAVRGMRFLMQFMVRRIYRLAGLRQELEISRKLNDALRKENRDLKATLDQSAEHGGNAIL